MAESASFVPKDFDPPTGFTAGDFRLEHLGPEHNDRDYAAWTSSMEAYSRWVELMSVRRVDVNGGPFVERIGLAYSLLTKTGRLICIIPLGFLGSASPTCAR